MKKTIQGTLKAFYMKLNPDLKISMVLEDLSGIYEELRLVIAPMYSRDIELGYKGSQSKNVERLLRRGLKDFWKEDLISTIKHLNEVLADQSEGVFDLVEKRIGKTIQRGNLDYQQINILRYLQALHFYMEYSRNLLRALVHEELGGDSFIKTPNDKVNGKYVFNESNIETFIIVVNMIGSPLADFEKKVKDLEGFMFDPEAYDVQNASNGRKIDPYMTGFIPPFMNPAYLVGLVINTYRSYRHDRNKEDLAALELLLLALNKQKEEALSDTERARIEGAIKHHSNRANRMTAKINKMEKGAES